MDCPKCGSTFKFRLNIVVRGVALAAEIPEETRLQETVKTRRIALENYADGELDAMDFRIAHLKLERKLTLEKEVAAGKTDASSLQGESLRSIRTTARFLCPHCNATLQLRANICIIDAAEWIADANTPDIAQTNPVRERHFSADGLTQAEVNTIEECSRKGVLQAFTEVMQYEYGGASHAPRRVERTFLSFITQAVQRKDMPRMIRAPFARRFPDAQIEFWSANRITVVTVSGEIYRFIPARVLRKSNSSLVMAAAAAADPDGTRNFQNWMRTRNGYVPEGSRLFLAALRLQSRGVKSGYDGGADKMEY